MPLVGPQDADIFILHVEDDEEDRVLCARRLESVPIKISLEAVTSAEEAQDYLLRAADDLEAHTPALILLDLHLPVMSGQEFLGWLRASESFDDVQVIVITTSADPTVLREARRLGGNAVLSKDFDTTDRALLGQMIVDYWAHGTVDPTGSDPTRGVGARHH